ncbi:MAG: nucleotide pyrophosphohydrolase [Promethearchaeota archaeon]
MNSIKISEAQTKVDSLIQNMGGYWPPLSMLASITEELGELAREINALEKFKPKKADEKPKTIAEELGDTLFSIICVANHYSVDLGTALEGVIEKYSVRDRTRFKK